VKFPKVKFPRLKFPWKQLRSRRRNVVTLALIGVAVILGFQFALVPILESQRKVRDEIVLKKKMLIRYQEYIKSGKDVEDGLNQIIQQVEAIQLRLLSRRDSADQRGQPPGDFEKACREEWYSDQKLPNWRT
jgi:hypothetical protein